ncbi:MAG: NAD(+) diphosphatase [Anaerolineae bacterium]|jgi:NAD+ diphosphatase
MYRRKRSAVSYFTALGIDRVTHRRLDEAWIAEQLQAATTHFIPVWGSKVLIAQEPRLQPILLPAQALGDLPQLAESVILLGEAEGRVVFALGLPDTDEPPPISLGKPGDLRDLHSVAALLDHEDGTLLAYAKAMTHWHRRHRFCGDCGSPTRSEQGGHLRVCTNPQCGQHHFPRVDPAIIVLVACGERCLLGRQPTWPAGRYSIIAGFVEPGEDLEAAVAREVHEETGIEVGRVRYFASQPWPFPSSLMLGFTAQAPSTTIRLEDGELEDARWLSREEIAGELRRGTLRLPPEVSISYRLIEDWFDGGGCVRLKHLIGRGRW